MVNRVHTHGRLVECRCPDRDTPEPGEQEEVNWSFTLGLFFVGWVLLLLQGLR